MNNISRKTFLVNTNNKKTFRGDKMSLLYRIKDLASQRKVSLAEVEREAGLSSGSITKWDKSSPKAESLQKVANYFNVTTDYLLGRTDTPQFTRKDERDVQKLIQEMIDGLSDKSYAHMNNGGVELDEEEAELLRDSLERTARRAKLLAKEKFTRNDYKKNKSE